MSGALNTITTLSSLGFIGNSAPVQLGSMTLAGVEVPSLLRVDGEQFLAVTTLPGGARTIQALGDNPASLTLSGLFVGPSALQRAEQMQAMRRAAAQIRLSVSRISTAVVVKSFSYTIRDKGSVCPYQITLEIMPSLSAAADSIASLTSLVGSDLASAITSVTGTLSDVAQTAQTAIAQTQTIIGQVTPLASLVGLGGPLSKVGNALSTANVLAQASTNFAAIPSSAATLVSSLGTAGASLMDTIAQSGGSLSGISAAAPSGAFVSDGPSLAAATGYAGVLAGAVQAGALVNRASGNAALATSAASLPAPAVHA